MAVNFHMYPGFHPLQLPPEREATFQHYQNLNYILLPAVNLQTLEQKQFYLDEPCGNSL